jgi:hypothetical protein
LTESAADTGGAARQNSASASKIARCIDVLPPFNDVFSRY